MYIRKINYLNVYLSFHAFILYVHFAQHIFIVVIRIVISKAAIYCIILIGLNN